MCIIFLFIDGVGLGKSDSMNPFHRDDYRGFSAIAGGQPFTEDAAAVTDDNLYFNMVDATLGVEGLPQSGTGQATLFSGENAAKEIGRHFGPFPHSETRYLLEEESLFIKARSRGKKCQFINGYPDIFFRKARKKNRWSCTTLMAKSAEIPLNTTEDVQQGRALTAELTQKAWREHLQIKVPVITPEEAADRLVNQLVNYDLLLHEYYLTDKAGHNQQMNQARDYIAVYDRFLWHLIQERPPGSSIVLCSDHGNVEDLSTKTHTYNKVPLACLGPGGKTFEGAESIQEVTPGILRILEK